MSDFPTSLGHLRTAIDASCDASHEWPARVVAGIQAVLRFAVADPAAARILTGVPYLGVGGDEQHRLMIEHFSAMLGEDAPDEKRVAASTDRAIVSGIATIVGAHLRADRTAHLEGLAPDLVYFSLLPYLGFSEAGRWAAQIASDKAEMNAPCSNEGPRREGI